MTDTADLLETHWGCAVRAANDRELGQVCLTCTVVLQRLQDTDRWLEVPNTLPTKPADT